MLWEVDIHPARGEPDAAAQRLVAEVADLGLPPAAVRTARGYLLDGDLSERDLTLASSELLADLVVERAVTGRPAELAAVHPNEHLVQVLFKPGVMDPVAQSALAALGDLGLKVRSVGTLRKYWIGGLSPDQIDLLAQRSLANQAIEQVIRGALPFDRLQIGAPYSFKKIVVPLADLDAAGLERLSRDGQLYLKLPEMETIQAHFRELGRDPTDAELETIAQTWSEHCSHKTLAGRIAYRDERGERSFSNMLKETIFAATQQIRRELGERDWCVSVFRDNAGVVTFDEQYHAVFKVETHNHPSALEPYGGANTGLGGVIRDPLGTGLGARPVCNTDVFCFAPPETPTAGLPPGVLHPKRVMKGVVSGVRDYGNRMGIPTVNGAVFFDPRYLGNPLVYCGTVGILPRDRVEKQAVAGDSIVVVGGRTGRDGIHGATFSSAELTSESETVSGGAVQIGNAITEKMLLDVLLVARNRGLYHAITDCGAGGLSSAVGEMGADLGAEVWLERAPLKYEGLSYTEIWISEAQERMVLAVPDATWADFHALCASEGVEATQIGRFEATGRLRLKYHGESVADLSMHFLHDGRPPTVRQATYSPPAVREINWERASGGDRSGAGGDPPGAVGDPPGAVGDPPGAGGDPRAAWLGILASPNVASKEWIIRQYDHEVQGGSVIKPLVGVCNDGPSDAAVVRPVLGSRRGLVIANGMNPRYGDFDPYDMAASAIDEALRNCVAVGADPRRVAILDNFCWGDTDRPDTLGTLVRAALACHDVAIGLQTPFISGKDSLNNEFKYTAPDGTRQSLAIPPSLLISAMGQVDDVERCVTMDLKEPGNLLYLVGLTREELGGSHWSLVTGASGGRAPTVDVPMSKATFLAIHRAIWQGRVRACHDLSEGGLAVAAAEMAFAGGLGATIDLARAAIVSELADDASNRSMRRETVLLFAESNTRFLCEVRSDDAPSFEQLLQGVPCARVGQVNDTRRVEFVATVAGGGQQVVMAATNEELKEAWQHPLRW